MIPGGTIHRLAGHICSAKTLERVVEPAIADLQKEYGSAGRVTQRVWVLLTGYPAILKVIAACAIRVSMASDEERRELAMILAWSAAMFIVVALLLIVPPLYHFPAAMRGWYGAMTVAPQAVALAIPLGVAFGIAFGLSTRPTMNIAKAMLICAFVASALSFGNLAWGVPAGSEAFRHTTLRDLRAKGYPAVATEAHKGYSEMTFSELRREAERFRAEGEPRSARRVAFSFHLRFALAAATLALASLLLAAPVSHRGWRGAFAFGACFTYWILLYLCDLGSRRGYLPVPIAAWLPNLGLIALAVVVASSRSSRLRDSLSTAQ